MVSTPPIQIPKTVHLTTEQFLDIVQANPDLRLEQTAQGELIIMPPTGSEGGIRNAEITTELSLWNRTTRLGKVFDSSTGFRLPNGATRAPDASWVSNKRWNQLPPSDRQTFAPICPDFVIELASQSDAPEGLREKMQEYLDNGSRLGWLILPKTHKIEIFQAGTPTESADFSATLSG